MPRSMAWRGAFEEKRLVRDYIASHGIRTWLVRGPIMAILALTARVGAAEPGATTKLDCGANALHILLRLEGRPVTIDRLDSALPPRRRDGYSMAELAAAAESLGLELEGVRFAKGDPALNRPAIAFIRGKQDGHFGVLRPVGNTGTMVQVIDPPHAPRIVDYDEVLSAKAWTGRILIPREAWLVRNKIPVLAATLGAMLLGIAFTLRLHRNQATSNAR